MNRREGTLGFEETQNVGSHPHLDEGRLTYGPLESRQRPRPVLLPDLESEEEEVLAYCAVDILL